MRNLFLILLFPLHLFGQTVLLQNQDTVKHKVKTFNSREYHFAGALVKETNQASFFFSKDMNIAASKTYQIAGVSIGNWAADSANYITASDTSKNGNPRWAAFGSAGSGTVTSITAGNGLTGGTITSSGTINVDSITNKGIVTITKFRDSTRYIHIKVSTFDTLVAIPTYITGQVFWNPNDYSLTVQNGFGTSMAIGQEIYYLIQNNTGSTINPGRGAYVYAAGGEIPRIRLSDTTYASTIYSTIGVTTTTIQHGGLGFITTFGKVHDLNTNGWEGLDLFVAGKFGELSNIAPKLHKVCVGKVIYGHSSNGILSVSIERRTSTSFAVLNNDASKWVKLDTLGVNTKGISIYKEDSIVATKLAVDAKINTKQNTLTNPVTANGINTSGVLVKYTATNAIDTAQKLSYSAGKFAFNAPIGNASFLVKGRNATDTVFKLESYNNQGGKRLTWLNSGILDVYSNIRFDGLSSINSNGPSGITITGNQALTVQCQKSSSGTGVFIKNASTFANTSNTSIGVESPMIFTVSGGTGSFVSFKINPTIDQSAASVGGETVGLLLEPSLTSPRNFINLKLTNSQGISIRTKSARSILGGSVYIGDSLGLLKNKYQYFKTDTIGNTANDFRIGRNADTLKIDIYQSSAWTTKLKVLPSGYTAFSIPHISLYRSTDTTISATQNVWYKLSGLTSKHIDGVILQKDTIQLPKGTYEIIMTTSFSGLNNEVWELGVFKNGSLEEPSQLRYTSTSDVGNMSIPILIESDGDDWISFKIRNTIDNDDPTIKRLSIIVKSIHLL